MTGKIKKILTGLLVLSLSVSLGFVLSSCNCGCSIFHASDVPLSILNKANDFIISKTGKEFFDKYITPDFALIKYNKPYYKMAYRFFIPDKPYVDELITFSIDKNGKVNTNDEITGIPDYKNNPASCTFDINEKQVIKVAEENGLKKGVNKWKVGLLWNQKYNQYVWHVLSTYSESGKGKDYKGNGREMLIDPNGGEVISANLWHIP